MLRLLSSWRSLRLRGSTTPELDPLAAYDLWAANYPPEAHNPLMQAEESAMLELLPDVRGLRVLDLACGSGRYLRHLKERGAELAVGLDFSPAMLARARADRRSLITGDMTSLPLADSSFDLVLCALAVGHIPNLQSLTSSVARILRHNGILLYSDFHPFGGLAGWTRSFHANGREYSVRHHLHLYADHHAACQAAGLTINAVREPCAVDERGERAWGEVPAVLVVKARKE